MKKLASVTAAAALLLALSACGTTDVSQSSAPAAAAPTSSGCDAVKPTTGPVAVTDVLGRTVKLDAPAKRVAVLEWQQTEDLLTLCQSPVAVPDVKGYSTWVSAEKLPDGVVDLGTRGEPSIDALVGAEPDLVIVEATSADDKLVKQLEAKGLKVLATTGADATDPIKNMLHTFGLIAEATGRAERADAVEAEFNASLQQGAQKIKDAGKAGSEFVYFDGWLEGSNVTVRPFGQGALLAEVGESLGLKNAWKGEVDAAYGLGQTDVEGLTTVQNAHLLYTSTADADTDIMPALRKTAIWSGLTAVKENREKGFPEGIWTFGGPRSSQEMIDAFVAAFTS
ncbi:iron-siderophore ABC transporter substrate-binding protein [Galactobacter caseinivorans]|uniref:Iron-siderophore ABC transporter substrate-binding protein n=1 Tax=Galactobacter caseinivorans TaxID=2676123 RepID=A0A496PHT5_9MICC|nr:iron-siderophore ABC transporter substrate-binding protein [Galactobacter caseinivorans]RKW70054.1 iron-siderophore ABC transporter substrate-binding protein [Galactobacter caseinivorans]